MSWKIAVVGATGNVGREMLNILAERDHARVTRQNRIERGVDQLKAHHRRRRVRVNWFHFVHRNSRPVIKMR